MRTKSIGESEQTHVLVFEPGDEVMDLLARFAAERRISAGHFTAIGAFSAVTVGFLDPETKEYEPIRIEEQVEALSVVGDIAVEDGEPRVHAHVVVGKRDGSAHGGHLLGAQVWPTLEVVLVESPDYLRRKLDPKTGLPLIALEDST